MKKLITGFVLTALSGFSIAASPGAENDEFIITTYRVCELETKVTELDETILTQLEAKGTDHEEDVLLLKSFTGTYVIKFDVINLQDDPSISLHVNQPLLDRADLFRLEGNSYMEKVVTFGESVPYSERINKNVTGIYNFYSEKGDTTSFVLLADLTENVRIPIIADQKTAIENRQTNNNYFFGVFAGIMVVMFLYNLFIAYSTKSRSYFLYSCYIIGVMLTQASLQGFSHKYLWPEFTWLSLRSSVFFPAIAGIAGIYFMVEFLQLRTKRPRFAATAKFYTIAYVITMAISAAGFKILGYNLVSMIAGTQSFHMLIILVSMVINGDRAAKFFLVAWCAFLIGLLLFLIMGIGFLEYNWITAYSMPTGCVIEVILLSFALADTINRLKEENERAKQRELQLSQEKAAILSEQNEKLEAEVQVRTKDIVAQKKVIEIKNKEVTDSIRYAERLQKAILPKFDTIANNFNDSFLFYKPKDIVSGDFYYGKVIGDDVYVVIADCTGHGVPGALVSVVGVKGLERCLIEFHLTETGEILNKLTELVADTFDNEDIQDGMDLSIIKWNKKTNKISFSGANNDLWLFTKRDFSDIRQFDTSDLEIDSDMKCYKIKGNRQPIGKYYKKAEFEKHEIELTKGDKIYMLTDGFCDQFGGLKSKKFMTANFIKLVYSLTTTPMKDQRDKFLKAFEDWSGEYEQIDDITVFGAEI